MNPSDREHLNNAIKQFELFLLNGLVASGENQQFSPGFKNSMTVILYNGLDELLQLSPELKERCSFVEWDRIEMMRDPLRIQSALERKAGWIRNHLRDKIPNDLEKIRNIHDEEE